MGVGVSVLKIDTMLEHGASLVDGWVWVCCYSAVILQIMSNYTNLDEKILSRL